MLRTSGSQGKISVNFRVFCDSVVKEKASLIREASTYKAKLSILINYLTYYFLITLTLAWD